MKTHRMEGCPTDRYHDMYLWCERNLQGSWDHYYPSFYFRDDRDYTLFLLRWT